MDQWVWTYGVSNFFNIPHSFFHPKDAVIFMFHLLLFWLKKQDWPHPTRLCLKLFWSLFFGKKVWLFYPRPQKHIKIKVLLLYDNNWILFFLCGAHWNVSFFSWRDQDKSWFVIKPMLMIFLKQSRVLIWSPLHYVLGDLCGSHSADVYWLRLNQVGLTMAHIKIALGGTFEHVENATIFDF